jgi:hypothetical protein
MTRKRLVVTVLTALVLAAGTLAGVSLANSASGHQNPRYVVTASLTPTSVPWHGDFWATVTVRNASSVRRTLTIEYEVRKPGSSSGAGFGGIQLAPGQVWRRAFNVHAGARGDYSLTIKARDGLGTSKATARGHAG